MEYKNIEMIDDNNPLVRYCLKNKGLNPLVIIALNPSTANEEKPDKTMNMVMRFAEINGFDSFVMLNLYPQRATFPINLDKEVDEAIYHKNLSIIKNEISKIRNATILLAYGNHIKDRKYLISSIKDIVSCLKDKYIMWKCIDVTKYGHPRHPSRAKINIFKDFDANNYIANL